MLTLLIGVIVLVGAGYLGFVFYQRRTINMETDVYENKRDLNKIPLDDEFALAKKMNLTGESHKKYDQLYNNVFYLLFYPYYYLNNYYNYFYYFFCFLLF